MDSLPMGSDFPYFSAMMFFILRPALINEQYSSTLHIPSDAHFFFFMFDRFF